MDQGLNRPMRALLYLSVLLLLVGTCFGQSSSKQSNSNTSVSPPKKTIATVAIPATSYREVGQAQISYFAESDTTEVRIELSVYRSRGQSANMFFVFTVKGRRVVRPSVVSVGMVFFTDKTAAERLHGFELEADGKSIQLEDATSGGVGYDYGAKQFSKDMGGKISFALLHQLGDSKGIKVHVGDIEFELNKGNRDALRDMLKAVER